MADLTRFDFHALRFLKSVDVMRMSAEEVGQYVLLLCEAWLIGDDTTLPDDEVLLNRLARGKVSERVLEKFPIVETTWGPRRQNATLYNEWRAAEERSISAAERGRKGNEIRYGTPTASLESRYSEPAVSPASSPNPTQAAPNQTIPNQVSSQCNFKFIAVRYSSFFGINHSHSKKHIEKYQNACARHGEDLVLDVFDRWASSAGWLKERRDSNGLNFFWKPMEEIIEGDQLRLDREESVRKPEKDLEVSMAAQIENEKLLDAQNEKTKAWEREERKKFEAANADQI